jgi:hypothetical protein
LFSFLFSCFKFFPVPQVHLPGSGKDLNMLHGVMRPFLKNKNRLGFTKPASLFIHLNKSSLAILAGGAALDPWLCVPGFHRVCLFHV